MKTKQYANKISFKCYAAVSVFFIKSGHTRNLHVL